MKKNSNTGQSGLFETEQIPIVKKEKEKREGDYVFDLMDSLTAPVLTFSQSWADTIPKRMLDLIPIARMMALMTKSETATDEECVVYIYTRTLEAPMSSEWTDIYLHLSCKVLELRFGEDHWNELKASKKLSEWLQSKLTGLRNHIYRKRREYLKGRLKSEEKVESVGKPTKATKTIPNTAHSKPAIEQASFDF
ncbi:hypothetical protein [Chitinophaga niabensis]|uniref:Uncharacterized protein n=1 Tax=Chitinophaga niabensis TaxID=536979 RepID=A0A1N6KBF5_9BACT|nr:hypothetical protein [Chitinophaga niabensis]SIO53888.1 hypothetical protein SAMN04488055_5499 [Chitinophaga niabensis]